MKTRIHVDQHAIRRNNKGASDPVLTVKDYKQNRKGNLAVLRAADGTVVGRFVYQPEHPLSCGAKVWFESDTLTVEVEQ